MIDFLINVLIILTLFVVLGFIFFCLIFTQYEQEERTNEKKWINTKNNNGWRILNRLKLIMKHCFLAIVWKKCQIILKII